jgi:hypothetical protein
LIGVADKVYPLSWTGKSEERTKFFSRTLAEEFCPWGRRAEDRPSLDRSPSLREIPSENKGFSMSRNLI